MQTAGSRQLQESSSVGVDMCGHCSLLANSTAAGTSLDVVACLGLATVSYNMIWPFMICYCSSSNMAAGYNNYTITCLIC